MLTETTIVRRLAGVLAVATILILPAAASAQAARDLRTACEADAKKFCAEEKPGGGRILRSEEHTSELQSLMRISYAVFCLKKKTATHAASRNAKQTVRKENGIRPQIQ